MADSSIRIDLNVLRVLGRLASFIEHGQVVRVLARFFFIIQADMPSRWRLLAAVLRSLGSKLLIDLTQAKASLSARSHSIIAIC